MARTPLRALIVEHDPLDLELIESELSKTFELRSIVAESLKDVTALLGRSDWDVILSDHNLPGWSGMEALALVQERQLNIPFILVTGTLGEERAAEYFRKGVTDYVLKQRLEFLPVAVMRALQEKALRQQNEQAERSRRRAEERYRTIVEGAPYGICVSGVAEDRFLAVNASFARMLGYASSSEVLQLSIDRDVYWDPEERQRIVESLASRSHFAALESQMKHKTGRPITVRSTERLITEDGEGAHYIEAFVEDITEAKRAQDALRQSEERYRLLFSESPLPMWVYDLETLRFLAVNAAAIAHYGFSEEEFKGMTVQDIRPAEEVVRLLKIVGHPSSAGREGIWRHRKKDGSLIDVEITRQSLKFEGRPAALILAQDVTEKLALEAQFRQAQKMEAVGRLAGGVAHDFNNCLMIINSYAQLLQTRSNADEVSVRYTSHIIDAGNRAADVSRQLLLFSRKQLVTPSILDLNTIVKNLSKMLPPLIGEDIEMSISLGSDIGLIKTDRGLMEQVLMNLVINARDAMPNGGKLIIETSTHFLDQQYARSHGAEVPSGWYVRLMITDSGMGMDAETRNRIFEPFFTTKEVGKGTGLGLATVYGIVKQAGGFIWVYSEVGTGTTFKIYLPRADEPATTTADPLKVDAPLGSETILLVEDEASLRIAAREYLETKGYRVLEASNGTEALRICSDGRDPIHVIITDMVMPGMSGIDLAKKAVAAHPGSKAICMSGYTDRSVDPANLPPGTLFLQKPFTLESLAHTIRGVLGDGAGKGGQ